MGQPCFSSAAEEAETTPISTDLIEAEWRHPGSNRPATHAVRLNSQKPHCRPLEAAAFISQCKTAHVAFLSALHRMEKQIARIRLKYFEKTK